MPKITIDEALTTLNCELPGSASDQFHLYWNELRGWRQAVNLTACETEAEFAQLFIVDPLSPQPVSSKTHSIVDLGTGAGNPGLALAIANPEIPTTLVDSRQRRCAFLNHMIGLLGLTNTAVVEGRAEELANLPKHRESYDLVTARAFGPVSWALECASGFARPGREVRPYLGPTEIALIQDNREKLSALSLSLAPANAGETLQRKGKGVLLHKDAPLEPALPRPWKKAQRAPIF